MSTDFDFSPTCPSPLHHEQTRPRTMAALRLAMDDLNFAPIITLGTAMEQLGLLAPRVLESLLQEDPGLLRSRSRELVRRLLVSSEDLHHVLARTAGIVEVDAVQFELPAQPFNLLPLRTLRAHEMLFLGDAHETLLVATWNPTSEDLHSTLCALTGRSVAPWYGPSAMQSWRGSTAWTLRRHVGRPSRPGAMRWRRLCLSGPVSPFLRIWTWCRRTRTCLT